MLDTNDRPGLDEQYLVATNTSNLTLNPDRTCAATHLIAAALADNRMAAALTHLGGEWAGADKPRKLTEPEISARAVTFAYHLAKERKVPVKSVKPDFRRARTEALLAYDTGLRHRAHSLSGWIPTMILLREWALLRGVDLGLLSPALFHHLSPACPVCDGRGHRLLPDAPVLGKQCHHCSGSGIRPRALGSHRIHDWFKGCIGKAKADRSGLINERIDAADLRERTASRKGPAEEWIDEEGDSAAAEHFRKSMGTVRLRSSRKPDESS
jgi:hypothetical protein